MGVLTGEPARLIAPCGGIRAAPAVGRSGSISTHRPPAPAPVARSASATPPASDGRRVIVAGLFLLAYVRDPRTHFIPIQLKLGLGDGLSEYIQHTGSALFAIPPGIAQGGYVGEALFA